MNAPNRHELFVLEDGEKGVEVIEDTKIPNAATIKIFKQDHTLGNMLRSQLLATPSILFAGYKVPHPLEPYFILKIQTDGSITPTEALEQAGNSLLKLISDLQAKFKAEFSYKDVEGADGMQEDPYGTLQGGVGATSAWAASVRDYADYT
ncbi:DNA-directed RNA polymerase [Hysterangium stoloniferum]|nr:DNA-directed RNA polymerase [Hysterangium stoloniferum]